MTSKQSQVHVHCYETVDLDDVVRVSVVTLSCEINK